MTWQGGGGYGDPLTRDPAAVARDLREEKITTDAARTVYGVIASGGVVDGAATDAERARMRGVRRDRSTGRASGRTLDVAAGRRLDDNLVEVPVGDGHVVACRHCGEALGPAGALTLARYDGPQIAVDYVDAPVVFRQHCCPNCWTAVHSAVVPADHVDAVGSAATG
jgi:N-methylhydantoinase B